MQFQSVFLLFLHLLTRKLKKKRVCLFLNSFFSVQLSISNKQNFIFYLKFFYFAILILSWLRLLRSLVSLQRLPILTITIIIPTPSPPRIWIPMRRQNRNPNSMFTSLWICSQNWILWQRNFSLLLTITIIRPETIFISLILLSPISNRPMTISLLIKGYCSVADHLHCDI